MSDVIKFTLRPQRLHLNEAEKCFNALVDVLRKLPPTMRISAIAASCEGNDYRELIELAAYCIANDVLRSSLPVAILRRALLRNPNGTFSALGELFDLFADE
jgi:hypothetical protein